MNITTKKMQELSAIQYCEKHGIVNYSVKGWILTYNESYLAYLNNPRYTIQHKIDLRSGTQIEVKQLKRFDPKGLLNR